MGPNACKNCGGILYFDKTLDCIWIQVSKTGDQMQVEFMKKIGAWIWHYFVAE